MSYFNEDNETEQMCIEVAKQAGYTYEESVQLRDGIASLI